MVIFQKIFSAIMALIMSFFSFVLPPVENPRPVYGEVIHTGSASCMLVNVPVICRNYNQLEAFCYAGNSQVLLDYLDETDEELFDNYCIVAVNFEVPDPSYKIYITAAEYEGGTLVVDYVRASFSSFVVPSVISYDTALLVADKNIRDVSLNCGEDVKLDFYPSDLLFGCEFVNTSPAYPYYPEDDGNFEGHFIFEDYESWIRFRDDGNWKFENIKSKIDEDFFSVNNLVVAVTTHSSGGYNLCFSDCVEDSEIAEIKLYSANEPGLHTDAINYEAALVPVGKDIKTAEINYKEISLPFRLDGKFFSEY